MARQVKEAAIDAAIVSVTASDQPILQALADEGLVRGFITRRPSCGLSTTMFGDPWRRRQVI